MATTDLNAQNALTAKRYLRLSFFLVLFIILFASGQASGQCSLGTRNVGATVTNTSGWSVGQGTTVYITCGQYFVLENTQPGYVYRISTAGCGYDSQLTLYDWATNTYLGYNDDNGPAVSGLAASIDFVGVSGYPHVDIQLNQYRCTSNGAGTYVYITLISQATPSPTSVGVSAGTICAGSGSTLTAYGAAGTVYWYTGGCGSTFIGTGNPITVYPGSTTTYYARNYSNGSFSPGCASATVTVSPTSVGGTVSGSSTVCTGTNSTTLVLSGYTGSITKWQSSPVSNFSSGVSDIASSSSSLTVSNLTSTTYYRAVVTSGVCSSATSSVGTITVSPAAVGGSTSGGSTVCTGTNSTTLTLSGYTGTISKWQSSTVSNFSSAVTDIANTTTSLTASNLTTTTYYRAVITSGACTAYSSTSTVTVSPASVGGTVSGGTTVCSGSNSTTLTLSGYTGTVTKWQSSTVSNFTASVTDIANTTTTLTATNLTGTTYYRAVVTSGVCSSANSSVATITVTPVSVGGTAAATTGILCTGSNTTITLSGYTGSIQWQQSANGSSGWANVSGGSGATSATYTTPNLSSNTYYRAAVTNGVCPASYSSTALVTVNPLSVGGSISGSATVCTGTNSTTLTLSGQTGSVVKWQSSTTSNFSANVTDINNTTTTQVATNLSATTYYRAVVQSGVCSTANSSVATVTVSPVSVGGTVGGTTTVCYGTNSTTLTLTGNTGSVTRWESSPSSDFSGFVTPINNTTTSLTASNLTATTYYRAVVTSSPCSSAYSTTASVTVSPTSVGGTISGGTTVCSGTNSTLLTLVGYTGTIQWQSSSNNVTFANISGATGSTYTATNLTATTYYRAILTSGICSSVYSDKATVTVSPVSAGGSVSGGTTVCSGTNSTTLTLSGYTGSVTKWQSSTSADFSAGVSDIVNTTATLTAINLTSTTYYRAVVTSGACPAATSSSATINVSPAATGGTISGATTVCAGSNSTVLTLNGSSGSIQWQSSANNSTFTNISGATGTSYTALNLAATTYYRAVITSGVCVVNSNTATMTVTPLPVVSPITGITTVCPGSTTTLTCPTAGGTWSSSDVAVATVSGGTVTGVSAGSSSITYSVTASGCSATVSASVTISTPLAAPTPVTATPSVIQTGGNSNLNGTSAGNSIYWYSASSGGTLLGVTASGANFNVTPSVTTTYYAEAGNTKSFFVNSFSASNAYALEQNTWAGDDRGGIAVTQNYFYYTGDAGTVRFNMPGLTNPVACTQRDGIFSDLSGAGTLYTLWNGTAGPVYSSTTNPFTVSAIRSLNADLSLGSTTISLSSSISLSQGSSAVYSGAGFLILQKGTSFYKIDLPSGTVTNLGTFTINRYGSESWATWGIAEYNSGVYSVLYRDGSSNSINRLNLSTGSVTAMTTFNSLSDMCCFTYAPWYNRWYFHHEGTSQFRSGDETCGYADGSHTSINTGGCPSETRTAVTVSIQNIPTVTTAAVSGILSTTAVSGGNVTSENGSSVTAKGVCWSTSTGPTVALATRTSDGTGSGSFISNLSGLTPGTTYYVRAYATNGIGTAYGSEVSFTTCDPGAITGTQQICSGSTPTLFDSSRDAIGMPGVVYQWQSSPDNSTFSDISGATARTFQAGTVSNVTYYRRNATSGSVTLSSNVITVSFSAGVPAPTPATATPAEILLGSSAVLNATSTGNNIKWYDASSGGNLLKTVASGADYTVTPSVITTYYAQAAPITCSDNTLETVLSNLNANYASIISQIPGKYDFRMDGPSGVNSTYIMDGGSDMYDNGNFINTSAGSVTYNDNSVVASTKFGTNGKYFTRYVSGLFVLAADIDNLSWFKVNGNYGSDGGGSTSSSTFSVNVGCKTFNCFLSRVYNAGDPSINELFIIPANPAATHTPIANTADSYHTLNGISASTRMFYLLYAGSNGGLISDASAQSIATAFLNQTVAVVNGSGACPSADRTAVTVTVSRLPVLTTTAVSSIGSTTASGGGNITSDGGSAVTARGICWSTTANPSISNSKTSNGTGTGSFTSDMTGLTSGTTYYVRAYATNALGTAYGSQVSFVPFTLGTFPAINKLLGDTPFNLTSPSSPSAGSFTYTSSNTGVATISGNTVTIVSAGTSTITATQAASGVYLGASTTAVLTVGKGSQTITFGAIPAKTFGVAAFTLSATASSGLAVVYSSSNTGIATVSGNTVTIVGAGSCTIYANQPGDANFNAAPQVGQTLTVGKADQVITFDALAAKTYGDAPFTLSATGGASGNPVTFTSSNTAVATISGNTVTILSSGSCTITANQAGNANYNAATAVSRTLTVGKKDQSISFGAIPAKSYGDVFTVSATGGNSGNPVVFTSSDATVATCTGTNGTTVTVLKPGTCTIYANQAGNTNYNAAPQVGQTLTSSKLAQTITFDALPAKTYGEAPFGLSATASSGLTVSYSSSNTAVATVSGSTVTITGAGSATITASQAGNGNYDAATSVARTLTVGKANQTVTLSVPGDQPLNYYTGSNVAAVTATSSSGLEVQVSINYISLDLTCTSTANIANLTYVSPGVYNLTNVANTGTICLKIEQPGDSNYNPVLFSSAFDVTKNNQIITFGALPVKTFGDPSFSLTATASSVPSLPITYTSSDTNVATISGNTVTITGSGSCLITASQAGNASYNPAPDVVQTLIVGKATPAITFSNISKTYGDASFKLLPTSNSSGTYSFRSGNTSVATISGDDVTILHAGTSILTVTQAATGNYLELSQNCTLTVGKASQAITLNPVTGMTVPEFLASPVQVTATATSGLGVLLSLNSENLATINGSGQLVSKGLAGTITIYANQPGNDDYSAAPQVSTDFVVGKASQTITFNALADKTFGIPNFDLTATASSGLPVVYASSNTSVATISGNTVTIVGAGTTTITASQPGNEAYSAAISVDRTLTVNKATSAIIFGDIFKNWGDIPFTLSASSASTGAFTYTSGTVSVATILGSTATLAGTGTSTITVNQAADDNYEAGSTTATLTVSKGNQAITFAALSHNTFGDADFALTATAGSGLAVTYTSSNTLVATVSGSTVTILSAGSTMITASQEGNGNWNPAENVSRTLVVDKATPVISSFGNLNKTWGDPDFPLNATSTSAAAIGYASSNTGVAGVSDNMVSIAGIGSTTLTASQEETDNYLAATKDATLTVDKSDQTITFGVVSAKYVGDPDFDLVATSSSNLLVTFTSSNPAVATISGKTVTIVGAGSTTITASQAGNTYFNPAEPVLQNFTVTYAAPTITSFAPVSVCQGSTVTIDGTYLTGATVVSFGGTSAASFTVVSNQQITAVAASGSSGDVSITTPGGTVTSAGISVYPVSVAGTAAASAGTICAGNSATISLTGYTGGIQWQAYDDAASAWNDITGETGATYTSPALVSGTYQYRAVVTSGVCSSGTSNVVTVQVDPVSMGGTTSTSTPVVCLGSTAKITLAGSTGSIQWQKSPDGTNGWTNINLATSDSYTTPALNVATYYRAVVTSGVCSSSTSTVTGILIDPLSVGGTASAVAGTVCYGSTTTINLAGHTGSIQWQLYDNELSAWIDITGETASSLVTAALTAATKYRARVTSGVCSEAYSNETTVSVSPLSVSGTAASAVPAVCTGTGTTLSLTGYTGTVQWQQSSNGTDGWGNVSGGSGAATDLYTTPALTVNTWYRAIVTSGVCSSATSNVAGIQVDPVSAVGAASVAASPICSGTSATLQLASHTGSIIWQESEDGISGWVDIPGATTDPYTTQALNAGVFHYRAVVTSGACSSVTSSVVHVTVNASSILGGSVSGSGVTTYGSSTGTMTLGGNTGTIQKWQKKLGSGSWSDIANTNATYSEDPASAGTWYYRAVVVSGECSTANSMDLSVTVNPKELTVTGAVVTTKTYDGNANAVITGAALSGIINSDVVVLENAGSGLFAGPNKGTNVSVTTAMTISGANAGNYFLTQPAITGNINAKTLTVTGTSVVTRPYNKTNAATLTGATLVGVIGTEDVSLANATTGTFSQVTVGNNIPVATAPMTLTGTGIGNYTLTQPVLTGTITQKPLTIVGLSANDKVYDKTTSATLSGSLDFVGFESGDIVTIGGVLQAVFSSATVANDVSVTVSGLALYGQDGGNYSLAPLVLYADITPKPLSVTGSSVTDKTYNGDANATLTGGTLSGLEAGDVVTLDNKTTGLFAKTTVDSNIPVTTSMSISGADSGNYSLVQPTLAGNILAKTLTVINATVPSKPYDATTAASIQNATLSGIVGTDNVYLINHTTGTFAQAGVGTGISVSTMPMQIAGPDAFNYTLTQPVLAGNITLRDLTITATNQTKIYGTTFTFDGSSSSDDYTVSGLQTGDAVSTITLTSAATAITATVGNSPYVITPGAATGTGLANYNIIYAAGSFEVTKAMLIITALDGSKTYGDLKTYLGTEFTTSGVLYNNDAVVSVTLSSTGDAVISNANTYPITPEAATGTGVGNYEITYNNGTLTVNKATLTVTADSKTKVYGDANPTLTYVYSGWKNGAETIDTPPVILTTADLLTPVGLHAGIITVASAVDNNYLFSYVAGDMEVTKAMLTVTAENKTKVYGSPNPVLTYVYSGWKNLEGPSVLGTLPSISTTVNATTFAGSYPASITVGSATDDNYDFTYVKGDFTVTKAMLTVTALPLAKEYGDENPPLSFFYEGWQNGDGPNDLDTLPSISTTVTKSTPAGMYYNATIPFGGDDNNYNFTYAAADFKVNKANLKVTAEAKARLYGDPNPELTYVFSGWKIGVETIDKLPVISTTANQQTPAGFYPGIIHVESAWDNNYEFSYVFGDLTVTRNVLTVTADPKTKVYGTTNPPLTFTYSGWKNGEGPSVLAASPVISTTVNGTTAAGTYPGAITLNAVPDKNYSFNFVPGDFTVTRAMLTITADPATKTYGDPNPALSCRYEGWKNGDSPSVLDVLPVVRTDVSATTPAGLYAKAVQVAGAMDDNYEFTYVKADFTVTKAMLTVTAESKTKSFGPNPELTIRYSGWKNNEGPSDLTTKPFIRTNITATSPVGVYPNAIAVSGGVDENYDFTYVAGNFTVGKAALTVTAEPVTRAYGDPNPVLTFKYSGWQNLDSPSVLDVAPSISTTVNAGTPAGVYTNGILLSGGRDDNYDFVFQPADFTVTKAMLTVSADAVTRPYGPNPELTVHYSGWKNGDGPGALTVKPLARTTVTATSPVGIYPRSITVSGGDDENYSFSYVAGDLTVTKAMLTIKADPAVKAYGDPNPALTCRYEGLQNGETASVLDVPPVFSTQVTTTTPAGVYANGLMVSVAQDDNYEFTYVPADFTVTKAILTVSAEPKTKTYGPNPELTILYSGWKNNEGPVDLTRKPVIGTNVTATSQVGFYANAITVSGGEDENYSFSYVPAAMTITKALITVSADAKTRVYGSQNPALTMRFSGWQNGENESVLTTLPALATKIDPATPAGKYANAITVSGGTDDQYAFDYVAADFTVTPRTLVPGIKAADKCYDGNNVATLTAMTLDGTVGSDDVTLTVQSATFSSSDPGTGKTVTATGLALAGKGASNYALVGTTVTTTANIFEVPLSPVSGPNSACVGSAGNVYSVAPGMKDYAWQVPAGGTITEGSGTNSITVTWTAIGANTVRVSYTNLSGCKVTTPASLDVNVYPMPAPAISGPSVVCNKSGVVVYSTDSGMTNYDWVVSPGGSIVSGKGTSTIEVNWETAGNQSVSVNFRNKSGCTSNSPAVYNVLVNQRPSTPLVTASGSTIVSSLSTGNQWYFTPDENGFGAPVQGAVGASITPSQSGWYWTEVTQNGCVSDPSNRVYRLKAGESNVYNLFPVPNDGNFTIEIITADQEEFVIQIYNQLGMRIYELTGLQVNGICRQAISLDNVQSGIYSVVLRSRTGDLEMRKFNILR